MGRRRSQSVTLHDVAKRAGVSIATASKALNDRPEVAETTRWRVQRAAADSSPFGIAYLATFDFLAAYGVPLYPFGYIPVLVFVALAALKVRELERARRRPG